MLEIDDSMEIAGKRLTLRDIRAEDRPVLIHWLHPDHEWHKTNGPYYPKAQVEEIPDIVDNWITAKRPHLRQRMFIVNNETDQIVGMVNRYWISEETHWPALGITIYDSAVWGKGFGYESLGLWCDYLFATNPNFVRLDLRTWSGNFGMMKLAEKLGFTREATFRMARIVEGEYYDGLGYGVLRDEWETRYVGGFTASLK